MQMTLRFRLQKLNKSSVFFISLKEVQGSIFLLTNVSSFVDMEPPTH